MVLPITFGKSAHRAITIDEMETEKCLTDEEIRDEINCWINGFRKRIKNIKIK